MQDDWIANITKTYKGKTVASISLQHNPFYTRYTTLPATAFAPQLTVSEPKMNALNPNLLVVSDIALLILPFATTRLHAVFLPDDPGSLHSDL